MIDPKHKTTRFHQFMDNYRVVAALAVMGVGALIASSARSCLSPAPIAKPPILKTALYEMRTNIGQTNLPHLQKRLTSGRNECVEYCNTCVTPR